MSTYTADVIIRETGAERAAHNIAGVGHAATAAHGPVKALEAGMDKLKEVMIALGVVLTVEKIIHMADEYNILMKRLGQVTSTAAEQTATWQRLSGIAQEHSIAIDGVVNMYVGLKRATSEYKISADQIMGAVNSISAILQANGRGADEVAGAMRRLSAGMMQGSVSGRAMTTLFVQFPELLEGIAKASGRSERAIKIMAENGTISMKTLIEWIGRASTTLQAPKNHIDEIGDAMIRLKNTMLEVIGQMDKSADGSSKLVFALDYLGKMFKAVGLIVEGGIEIFSRFITMGQQVVGIINMLITRVPQANPAIKKLGDDLKHITTDGHGAAKGLDAAGASMGKAAATATGVASATSRVASGFDGLKQKTVQLKESKDALNTTTGAVTVSMGGLGTRTVELGAGMDNLNGKITVTRGGLTGFTKEVYENGKAVSDNVVQMSRTSSQVDKFGNSVKTVTESIRDTNGQIIGLTKTIETMRDGVQTVQKYTVMEDGSLRLLSETVVEATRNIDSNSAALSKNAMALSAVTSSANSAASAYEHLGHAQVSASSGGSGKMSEMEGMKGTFTAASGYHFEGGGNPMMGYHFDQYADRSTLNSFSEFNNKIAELKKGVLAATGVSEWNWPKSSAYNPYAHIPPPQKADGSASSPSGSIPSLQDLLSHLQGGAAAATSSGGMGGSITMPPPSAGGLQTFAGGGSFEVPGSGGTDSQYVQFMATPKEQVTVRRPGDRDERGGDTINVSFRVEAKDATSFGRNRTQILAMMNEGIARAQSQLQRRRS